ncbi:hypothetical protein [Staphylococcus haemolyticus]|uniref:hypothetical protein n=1 Tax=Staphylococcus haemolyticus TaxID=1283 RepID=UPI00190C8CA2|nr:hypothetical protein [Staphylococcus haemolyticus]MBK3948317.1 hypothetical protein [Staphylococcus haemolyticus]
MEQTIFLSISEDEIFRIAKKENILYSEYSNINDLKELDIFKNYKNLKEMLSYFIGSIINWTDDKIHQSNFYVFE